MEFDKFKKMFDKNFAKVTGEEFVKEMESLGYEFVDSKPIIPSFWFMRDGFTFTKPKGNNLDEIINDYIRIAKENPYGMVCPVTLMQGKKELSYRVGESAHVDQHGNVDLTKWIKEVKKEACVLNYKGQKTEQ